MYSRIHSYIFAPKFALIRQVIMFPVYDESSFNTMTFSEITLFGNKSLIQREFAQCGYLLQQIDSLSKVSLQAWITWRHITHTLVVPCRRHTSVFYLVLQINRAFDCGKRCVSCSMCQLLLYIYLLRLFFPFSQPICFFEHLIKPIYLQEDIDIR